jgi:hypothetical protein
MRHIKQTAPASNRWTGVLHGIYRKFSASQQQQLQPWQWFVLLYLLGFCSLLLLAFLLKMLIKTL